MLHSLTYIEKSSKPTNLKKNLVAVVELYVKDDVSSLKRSSSKGIPPSLTRNSFRATKFGHFKKSPK